MTISQRICYALGKKGVDMFMMQGFPRRVLKGNEKFGYVFDVEKFSIWFEARKKLNPKITQSDIAKEIGFSKGYLSQLLHDERYDILPSNEFIATWTYTYHMDVKEMFRWVCLQPEFDSIKPHKQAREKYFRYVV